MPDEPLTPQQWKRQVAQHLDSLKQAGVQWLPAAPPMAEAPRPQPAALADASEALFDAPEMSASPASRESLPLDQRRTALQLLAKRVATCTRCPELASTRTQTVFADGTIPVELCLVGEAPGGDEDAQGKPFVGAAGQLLNKILAACGLRREEVYICNILKCRPPGNRTPKPEEAEHCREYLTGQIELVQPKFICALGGCAAQNLLQTTRGIGQLRGRFHDYRGIPVLCTYHPSYLLPHRYPAKKRDVWEDMKLLMSRMGRTIPPRAAE
jgi:uracil-DNA glycosylase